MNIRVLLAGLLLTLAATFCSAQISPATRVDAADVIVEGTVTTVTSHWNPAHTMIYSTCRIAVNDQLKGDAVQELEFTFAGGRVGNDMMTSTAAPSLRSGSHGVFFFSGSNSSQLSLLPGSAGYVAGSMNEALNVDPGIDPALQLLKAELSLVSNRQWSHAGNGHSVLRSPSSTSSIPAISFFTPASLHAGTGDVLTIKGTGFGTTQGTGKVLFTNADVAGLVRNVEPYAVQYLQWSDTSIQVVVPSLGAAGNGTAGTGRIEVITSTGDNAVSLSSLYIPYAVVNVDDNGTPVRPDLINDNSAGGFTFTLYDTLAQDPAARQTFFHALERWTCATQVNYTTALSTSTAAAGFDGVNVVRFDSMSTFIMGVVYNFYSMCSGNWYLTETDVVFNNQRDWNYSSGAPAATQTDFESNCVTLIGFSMLVDHVVDINDVMHGEAPPNGTVRRNLVQNNIDGLQSTLILSTTANSCGPGAHVLTTNCAIGAGLDADVAAITWPHTGFCQGTFPVTTELINRGTNTLTAAQFNWTYDGVPQTPFAWAGTLLHGDTASVIIGNVALTTGTHTITVWTSNPNAGVDDYADNDTASSTPVTGTCTTANAGVNSLTNPTISMCPGLHNVSVTVRNYATTPLNYVQIHWKVNGVLQPPYTWSGTVGANSTSSPIVLGAYSFTGYTNTIEAWTVYPNGLNDLVPTNDTLNGTYNPNGMIGTYTVGGAGPDFIDFATAIANLNGRGLCGPVILDIRPGIYTGTSTLTAQTSATKTLLIRSENADSSSVIITHSSGAVFTINNSDYVTLEKLTFQTTDATTSTVCSVTNDANNIDIHNCVFLMPVIALPSQNVVGVWPSGTPCDSIRIAHCRFENGSSGIIAVPSSGNGYNLEVADCIIRNQREAGVGLNSYRGIEIHHCLIDLQTSAGAAINLQFCNAGFAVHHNTIITSTYRALYINGCDGTATARGAFFNNFISILNFPGGSGIYISGSSYLSFDHNTMNGVCGTLFSVDISTSPVENPHLMLRNNIMSVNNASSWIYGINNTSSAWSPFDAMSNNAYHFVDGLGDFDNYMWAYSLPQWMGYTQSDTNSVVFDPAFASATDLHLVPNASNLPVCNAGNPSLPITDDNDGDARNPSAPDIGADEFGFNAADASVTLVLPTVRTCTGSNPVTIEITNFGTATLTSAVVHWTVNSVAQPNFNWSGTLAPNATIGQITIGNYNFAAATYTIVAWTDLPNATADGYTGNDSFTQTVTGGGMSGVYTIGGVSPSYATLTAAKNALVSNGVCGNVIFDIRPGTYNETVVYPAIPGASSTATITFRAENGDSSTVILNGAAGIPVTVSGGEHYTFSRVTMVSSNAAVSLSNARHTTISHCNVSGQITHPVNTVNTVLVIEYSRLSSELVLDGYPTGNLTDFHKGVTIRNNLFTTGGLDFTGVFDIVVTGNQFPDVDNQHGLHFTMAFDTVLIAGNNIRANAEHGIEMEYMGGAIYNVPLIANNMIIDSSVTMNTVNGIDVTTYTSFDIFNNTCITKGPGTGGQVINGRIEMNGVLRIYNNALVNMQGGKAIDIRVGANPNSSLECDYNAVYGTGVDLFSNGIAYTTLPQWIAGTGFDVHSVFAIPQFVSATDLHSNNDVMMMDAGIPLPEVTTDFDGEARSASNPDLGADEYNFVPQPLDAGIHSVYLPVPACAGTTPVSANIRNYGSANLTSATVNWTINGVPQTPFSWTGNLALLDSTGPVVIGNFNFVAPDTFTIAAWITAPNAGIDLTPANDTATYYNYIPRLGGVFTVGGSSPDFASLYDVIPVLETVGICGNVVFNLRPGTYSWPGSLQPVTGAGPSATITFQSENGDSTGVTISSADFGTGSYVRFHQVRISGGTNAGSGSSHISFTNCYFPSGTMSVTGVNHYFLFENCYFTTSLVFNGSSSTSPEMGNTFRNNRFENCAALSLNAQRNCLVEGNTFDCPTNTSAYAISLVSYRDSVEVTKNYVNGGYDIGIYSSSGNNSVLPLLIANNMIAGNTDMNTGIQMSTGSSGVTKIYANNIYMAGTGPCVHFFSNNSALYNNVLKAGTGYAYLLSNAGTLDSADYNDVYTSGPVLVRWLSTNCSTLVDLQTTSAGMEMHSLNVDPLYVSATDLHIVNQTLDGAGVVRPQVNDDFDGEPRMNPPDIGADERNFYPHDAGVMAPLQPNPACEGPNTFSVVLRNYGMQTLTSADIQWSLNGIPQTPVNWTGSLTTAGSATVILGTATLAHTTSYQLLVWTENPNAVTDGFNGNDTLTATLAPRMAGTFTIGGASPDYPDFTSAVDDLVTFGVCGPVIFNVRNGTYNEQITIPAIAGSSAVNTIVFQSENSDSSLVTLSFFSGSSNNYVIEMYNAGYVTFREMTIKALNPQYGKLVYADGVLTAVNFENNAFLGAVSNPASPYDHVLVRMNCDAGSADCYLRNNYFKDGGVGIFSDGPWTNQDTSSFIINNRLEDQNLIGIMFQKQYYQVITYNVITTSVAYDTYHGIESYLQNSGPYIAYNRVNLAKGVPMTLNDVSGGSLVNNFLTSHQDTTTNYGYAALGLSDCSGLRVYHNTIVTYNYRFYGYAMTIGSGSVSNVIKNNIIANLGGSGFAIYWYQQTNLINNTLDHNAYYTCCSDTLFYGYTVQVQTPYADLAAWQAATGQDMNSVVAPPQNISAYDERIFSNVFLDNEGDATVPVADDMSNQPRSTTPDIGADEFSSVADDIAVVYVRATNANCGGGNVRCQIGNFGTNTVTSAEIHWSVNGVPQPTYSWSGTLPSAAYSAQVVLGSYTFVIGDVLQAWTALPNGNPDQYVSTDTAHCAVVFSVAAPELGADDTMCSGNTVVLSPGSYASYLWSTGATTATLTVSTTGIYSVIVMTSDSCYLYDTVSIYVAPSPPAPVITQNGANLLSSYATGNQWYYNGSPIAGATSQLYLAILSGQYHVVVTDANGCTSSSAPVFVVGINDAPAPLAEVVIYPNPSEGAFTVEFYSESNENMITIYDAAGRTLTCTTEYTSSGSKVIMNINIDLPAGMYLLEVKSGESLTVSRIIIQ
jgi:hypothetical protein